MLRSTILAHMSDALNESKFRFKQLQELEAEVSWHKLVELVSPYYNVENGSTSIESMLRIYFLTLRYGMTDLGMENALSQIEALRTFALINIEKNGVPSAAEINGFAQLISDEKLQRDIANELNL